MKWGMGGGTGEYIMKFDDFLSLVDNPRPSTNDWWVAQCPSHDDKNASLAFKDGDRAIITKCHAGCTSEQITDALGIQVKDLYHSSDAPDAVYIRRYDKALRSLTLFIRLHKFLYKRECEILGAIEKKLWKERKRKDLLENAYLVQVLKEVAM